MACVCRSLASKGSKARADVRFNGTGANFPIQQATLCRSANSLWAMRTLLRARGERDPLDLSPFEIACTLTSDKWYKPSCWILNELAYYIERWGTNNKFNKCLCTRCTIFFRSTISYLCKNGMWMQRNIYTTVNYAAHRWYTGSLNRRVEISISTSVRSFISLAVSWFIAHRSSMVTRFKTLCFGDSSLPLAHPRPATGEHEEEACACVCECDDYVCYHARSQSANSLLRRVSDLPTGAGASASNLRV